LHVRRALPIAACILLGITGFVVGQFALPKTGLRANYYSNLTRSGPPVATTIDREISTALLAAGTASAWATYSVEWTGAIVIDRAGTYTFATLSDDGSEMDVADVTVVRNGGLHGPQEMVGRIELSAGVHPVRVRYEQAGGGFQLELKYALEGQDLSAIPSDILVPGVTSLTTYRVRRALPIVTAVIAMLLFVASRRFLPGLRIDAPPILTRLDDPRVALALIVFVALAARVLMMMGSTGILWADSDVFLNTSEAIRRGEWFEHDPYRTLLYPYFLSSFLVWSGEKPMDQVIVGAQHLLGVLAAIGFFVACRSAFGTRVALVGALLFSVHTTQLFYEISILTEALFNGLLAWSLVVMLGYLRQPTLARAVAVAAVCVVLTMTRPAAQWFIAVPMVLTVLLAVSRRQRATYAFAMLAIYVGALLPWMAINQRTYGFFGVAMGQGLGLFIRTSQIERYEPDMYRGYPEIQELLTFARTTQSATGHVVDGLRRKGYSSAQVDRLLYQASLSAIAQRPAEFAVHTARQWWRQLGSLDDEDICTGAQGPYICSDRTIGYAREPFLNRPRTSDEPVRKLVVGYFRNLRIPMHVVTVLAMFGAFACFTVGPPLLLARLFLISTVVYFTLLPAATQSLQDRFRLPVDALLFCLAAFGVTALAQIVLQAPTPAGRGRLPSGNN